MRNIDSIIVHCSATKAGQDFTATDIDRWHRERGFNGIGYHYVIRLDGKLEKGRDVALAGAHCKGWNEQSIGICYIGGLDENGRPADTRTNAQKRVLYQIIIDLQREYNILQVLGHRDTSPDLNGDGVIEPYEYVKGCPCFDVKEFLRSGRELLFVLLVALVVTVLLTGCWCLGTSNGLIGDGFVSSPSDARNACTPMASAYRYSSSSPMIAVRSSACASNPEREKNPYRWHVSPVRCTCSISSPIIRCVMGVVRNFAS